MNVYKINYYLVEINNPQLNKILIRVKKISKTRFVCFFISENLVSEFETLGFVVDIDINEMAVFKNSGITPISILENVWSQIYLKIDFPDHELEIKGFGPELDDRLL